MPGVWRPNVTVAAVIEKDGHFLLVEEKSGGAHVFNQPAGHWEPGETLAEACAREALEESAYRFAPGHLLGIYRWTAPEKKITYLRFAFSGKILGHEPERKLDKGIVRAVWMTIDEIRELGPRHRSPLVLRCIEDYLAGRRYPLELLVHYE